MKILKAEWIRPTVLFCIFALMGVSLFSYEPSFVLKIPLTYMLLVLLGLGLFLEIHPNNRITNSFDKNHGFSLLFSIVLVMVLFGANLQAKWGPIDDHEIMSYLGIDQNVSITEIPALALSTEAGRPGETLRYRPIYQALRVTETATWGNNPQLWYAFRLLILISALFITLKLIKPVMGFVPASLLVVYLMTYQMWVDMFSRLGPSETYTVIGLALYALSIVRIASSAANNQPIAQKWILIWLLSTVLCVGSKENYVLLAVPNVVLYGYLIFMKRVNVFITLAFGISLLWTVFVAGAFLTAISNTGTDVYGTATTVSSRLGVFNLGLRHIHSKLMVLAGAGLTVFAIWLYLSKYTDKTVLKNTIIELLIIASCLAVFLSQFVFYNADWPNHSRYDFPGVLAIPTFFASLLLYLKYLLETFKVQPVIVRGLKYGVLAGVIFITVMRGFVAIQVKVSQNVERTQAYTANIERQAQTLQQNPNRVVVVESGNPWDYEPVFAQSIFLRGHGVTNTLHLRTHNYSAATVAPGIEQRLANELLAIQMNGGWNYEPLPTSLTNCFSILLTAAETECEPL
jgi:hypothetical protein